MAGRVTHWILGGAAGLLAATLAATLGFAAPAAPDRWWKPGEGRQFPAVLDYPNDHGSLRTLLIDGPMETRDHAFFIPSAPMAAPASPATSPPTG